MTDNKKVGPQGTIPRETDTNQHQTTSQCNGESRQDARADDLREPLIARHHLDMLAASGITAEHAALRGYETITDKRRLAALKITAAGRNVPGLLVPQLRDDGSTWGWQYRPDDPRLRDGKPVKYETPWQQRNGLDIPPGVAARSRRPNRAAVDHRRREKSRLRRRPRPVHRRTVRGVELAVHRQRRRQDGAARLA